MGDASHIVRGIQPPPRKNDLPSIDGECAPISGCWWLKSPEHPWEGGHG
jgi:hypothetical protein